ncbi:hypothetical protein RYX36_013789 [Vicia faba]
MEAFVRIVQDGKYKSCWKIVHDRNWDKLYESKPQLNLEIVREFYVNALPLDGGRFEFKNWVQADDELCEFHDILARKAWDFESVKNKLCLPGFSYELSAGGIPQKFIRGSLKTKAQLLMTVVLYNIRPHSHTSSIPMEVGGLLDCILEGKTVDVARLISNELKKVALSGTSLGDRTPCQLTYPGLIMGLCRRE